MENIFAQLEIQESHYQASFSARPDRSAAFEFALCRNRVTLRDVAIDQFWMPIPSLYGQRGRRAVNREPLIELWWRLCEGARTQGETGVQETYLLAKILPQARGNGSRRVFVDSFQTIPANQTRRIREWTTELDGLLTVSRREEYDEIAFQRATGDLIGPPSYDEATQDRYEVFRSDLFEPAREILEKSGPEGTTVVLSNWRRLMNSIGRRSGNQADKQILDIFSYECRAALHRCYSAVWSILLPALGENFDMTNESYVFHQLWHFDRCRESDQPDNAYFHLFHGHIFGLHPACGPVLLTRCGGEIFAEWLQAGTLQSYHRVLHALAVAVGYYAAQHEITRQLRKGAGSTESYGDMVGLEEQQASGRRRQRRRHRPLE